jgi:hypothetical protein
MPNIAEKKVKEYLIGGPFFLLFLKVYTRENRGGKDRKNLTSYLCFVNTHQNTYIGILSI